MSGLLQVSLTGYAYICIGGFIALFSIVSFFAREKVYINEVVVATAFGILMGPLCADIFDPRSWTDETDRVTLEVTRVVLATGLFAIGAELPKGYMYKHVKGLLVMVVPTMTVGWFIVAGLLKAIFNRFSFVTCLVIAACLTPTDPIISASVIGGGYAAKHVPEAIRNILVAESAANDGLAYPFISISLYLLLEPRVQDAVMKWILIGVLYQVILGTVIGAVIGYLFSLVMTFSRKRAFSNYESYMAQYFALAILTMGIINIIGSDDLLGAFAAGCAFTSRKDAGDASGNERSASNPLLRFFSFFAAVLNYIANCGCVMTISAWFRQECKDDDSDNRAPASMSTDVFCSSFASVLDYILNCGCFIYIGAWFSWEDFTSAELGIRPWKLVVLSIGILILRRLPALLLLYKWVPEIRDVKEALFCGHFGPMGVSALFIATMAKVRLPEPRNPPETQEDYLALALHPIVSFVILVSIIIHGLSIAFITYGKKVHRRTGFAEMNNTFGHRTWTSDTQVTLSPPVELKGIQKNPLNDSSGKKRCFNETSGFSANIHNPERTFDLEAPPLAASGALVHPCGGTVDNVFCDSTDGKVKKRGLENDIENQISLTE